MTTSILAWFLFGFCPAAIAVTVFCFALAAPLRREERVRFFIELLLDGLKRGRSVEQTVIQGARTRDSSLGLRFHLLASYLEGGVRLSRAIGKVSGFVPPKVEALLAIGEETGEMQKLLEGCKTTLRDAQSQTRAAYNYLFVLVFVLLPIVPAITLLVSIFVLPKFNQIFADMFEEPADVVLSPYLIGWNTAFAELQLILAVLFLVGVLIYVGGPRFVAWAEAGFLIKGFDRFFYRVPWRRRRMERDFLQTLSILLDASVPEEIALRAAARATDNAVFVAQSDTAVRKLQGGQTLVEVMVSFDRSSELSWRLENAAHPGSGFQRSLTGWIEALDAKAYQQEQAVAQVVTTSLVLMNGANVAAFIILVFGALTSITERVSLW